MSTFDSDLASRGWALISEGSQMISLAYAAIQQPAAAGASAPSPARSAAPADYDDYDPLMGDAPLPEVRASHVETVLSQCPDHQRPWTIKAAGVGKNGKPYQAFWRCAMKNGDTWCAKKPVKAWVDSHPIEEGAAA